MEESTAGKILRRWPHAWMLGDTQDSVFLFAAGFMA